MVVSGKTKVLGILGYPVYHSASPLMHNAMASLLNIDYVYVPFRVPPSFLKQALEGIKALDVLGVNVTIPHKEAIIPFLDDVTAEVAQVGACNTVVIKNKKLFGHNTDVLGYWRGLNEQCPSILERKDSLVAIIGAGGAAKAVVAALKKQEFKNFCFFVRNVDAAREIIKHFGLYGARILNLTRGIFSLSDEVGLVVDKSGVIKLF